MKALSIRQPWAWAILHAGKRIENRNWCCHYRGPILIHASKGMTRDEYDDGLAFIAALSDMVEPPPLERLERGGIVGVAEIVDCVTESDDEWFEGPFGIVLRNQRPVPFRPCRGALGLFEVEWTP